MAILVMWPLHYSAVRNNQNIAASYEYYTCYLLKFTTKNSI